MQNLWYFVDPYINNSTVREDTPKAGIKDSKLNVVDDYVVDFQFKGGETIAALSKDTNGDGLGDTVITPALDPRVRNQGYCSVSTDLKCSAESGCPEGETCNTISIVGADDLGGLWRAGEQLWKRDLGVDPASSIPTFMAAAQAGVPAPFL